MILRAFRVESVMKNVGSGAMMKVLKLIAAFCRVAYSTALGTQRIEVKKLLRQRSSSAFWQGNSLVMIIFVLLYLLLLIIIYIILLHIYYIQQYYIMESILVLNMCKFGYVLFALTVTVCLRCIAMFQKMLRDLTDVNGSCSNMLLYIHAGWQS